MSHTYQAPFTVNGERIGTALLTEQDDGTLVVTAILPDDQEKAQEALKLQVNSTSVGVHQPPSDPHLCPERPVGESEVDQ